MDHTPAHEQIAAMHKEISVLKFQLDRAGKNLKAMTFVAATNMIGVIVLMIFILLTLRR